MKKAAFLVTEKVNVCILVIKRKCFEARLYLFFFLNYLLRFSTYLHFNAI